MKRKLQRYNELESFTNVFQEDCRYKGIWKEYFKNDHPIVLELGCGRGEYTIDLARANPDFNYIGIDIKGARLWRGAKTAFEENMSHVAFLRIQIESICDYFQEAELSEIWVTFPDPQPSQRRMKKRLTYSRFLAYYRHLLKPQGLLHLKTDNSALHDFSIEEIGKFGGIVKISSRDIYKEGSAPDDLPAIVRETQTTYEKKYLREGRAITYLAAELPSTLELPLVLKIPSVLELPPVLEITSVLEISSELEIPSVLEISSELEIPSVLKQSNDA